MKLSIFTILLLITQVSLAQNEFAKVISKERVIPSYHLEIAYDKTVHILFPSCVTYIDLGSGNLIAGKASGAENVVRVKAAVRDFKKETNFSVITDEGSFYSFLVNYAENPRKLNIEMKDFLHEYKLGNQAENAMDIYLSELGAESPVSVDMAMKRIYKSKGKRNNRPRSKKYGIEFRLEGIYSAGGLLYFKTEIQNSSGIAFEVDYLSFKIVDKRVAKRTAIQETLIEPVRDYNKLVKIGGNKTESSVFAFRSFTIPDKKELVVDLFEKDGGRHQRFIVRNEALVKAKSLEKL